MADPPSFFGPLIDQVPAFEQRGIGYTKDAVRQAFKAGKWRIARGLIDGGLRVSPHEIDLQILSGYSHLQAERYQDAESAFQAARIQGASSVELQGRTDSAPPANLALVEGLRHSLHALVSGDERTSALAAGRISADAGAHDYADALHLLDGLLLSHENCGRTWLALALVEAAHIAGDVGSGDFEVASLYAPAYVGSWHVTAWVHLMFGNTAQAKLAFESALAMDPELGETRGGLAVIAVLYEEHHAAHVRVEKLLGTMMERPGFYGDAQLREHVLELIARLRITPRSDTPQVLH